MISNVLGMGVGDTGLVSGNVTSEMGTRYSYCGCGSN